MHDLPPVDINIVLPKRLSHSLGYSVNGNIYVQLGTLSFPSTSWHERISDRLIDWCRKLIQLHEGSRSEELWFSGKGNRLLLTAHGEQEYWTLEALSGWPNARRLAIVKVRKSDFIRTLTSATTQVATYAREERAGKKLLAELEGWLRQLKEIR